MIFESIYSADFKSIFDPKLIGFSVIGTVILFLVVAAGSYFLLSDRKAIGSFVQGSFRSNFIIIGIPLIKNLSETLGANAVSKGAIIISFILPLYNILTMRKENQSGIVDFFKSLVVKIPIKFFASDLSYLIFSCTTFGFRL